MNAHQRRITHRALHRLLVNRTPVSFPSFRFGAPRVHGRVVEIEHGGKPARAILFRPQEGDYPYERVTLQRLRVLPGATAVPVRYESPQDEDGEDDHFAAPTCPVCGGDGMDDDVTPCEHCDGEGVEWWLS